MEWKTYANISAPPSTFPSLESIQHQHLPAPVRSFLADIHTAPTSAAHSHITLALPGPTLFLFNPTSPSTDNRLCRHHKAHPTSRHNDRRVSPVRLFATAARHPSNLTSPTAPLVPLPPSDYIAARGELREGVGCSRSTLPIYRSLSPPPHGFSLSAITHLCPTSTLVQRLHLPNNTTPPHPPIRTAQPDSAATLILNAR